MKSSNTKTNERFNTKRVYIGVAIIILLIAGLGWMALDGWSLREKSGMVAYLRNKYGKEFTVSNIHTEGAGLGMSGTKVGGANPNEDPTLAFKIYGDQSGTYRDNYPGAIWTREESSRLAPVINQIFDNGTKYTIVIQSARTLGGNLDIKGDIPPFVAGVDRYGKKIRYSLTITGAETIPSSVDKDLVSAQILKLRDKLPIDEVSSSINYYIHIDSSRLYGVSLSGDDLQNIDTASELSAHFKEYKQSSP